MPESAPSSAGLTRTLRLRDLFMLTVGGVIGSGIFLVPGGVLRQVGNSVGLALLVWLAGGVLSLLGALTYGELTAMNPATGGLYVYIREAFGRLPAFLYGWALFLVIASGAVATLAVAFSSYCNEILPLSRFAAKAVAVGMIAVVTAVNVRGTRQSSDLQNSATFLKLAALAALSIFLLARGQNYAAARASLWPQHFTFSIASGFGLAMIGVLWAYEGWQFISFSAGETTNPQRDYPRAFSSGTLCSTFMYVVANLAYLAALGPAQVATSNAVAATSVAVVGSAGLAKLVALAILVSTFSAANQIQLTAPRVYYAMAADGLFFRKLASVHPRFHTPAVAILAGGAWSAVLACSGTFQQLFTYVIFVGWIFYGLAAASVFILRRTLPTASRPYRVPGYPVTPALFVLAASALVVNTILSGPKGAAEGLAILFAGLPAYFLWRRSSTAPPLK